MLASSILQGSVKKSSGRSSRRCGPTVVSLFHCTFHAWVGRVSEIKYGLIAAARGAFTS